MEPNCRPFILSFTTKVLGAKMSTAKMLGKHRTSPALVRSEFVGGGPVDFHLELHFSHFPRVRESLPLLSGSSRPGGEGCGEKTGS